MQQATRNKLRNVVTQCRRLLEEAVLTALQGRLGIYLSKNKEEIVVDDVARLGSISDENKTYRSDLLDHVEHIKAFGTKPKDALAQLREYME